MANKPASKTKKTSQKPRPPKSQGQARGPRQARPAERG